MATPLPSGQSHHHRLFLIPSFLFKFTLSPYETSHLVLPCHCFRISELVRYKSNQDYPCFLRKHLFYSLAHHFSFFLKKVLLVSSFSLFVEPCLPFSVKLTHSAQWFHSDFHHFCKGTALAYIDSLQNHNFMICTDGYVPFSSGKKCSNVLNNSLCDAETTLFYMAGSVCSNFSAEAWVIL